MDAAMPPQVDSSQGAGDQAAHGKRHARLCYLCLCAVYAVYLFQMVGPLRLTTDAVAYLRMAQSAAGGGGFLVDGRKTHFPPGYPAVIVALDAAGMAKPWGFVGFNCLMMAVGLAAACALMCSSFGFGRRSAPAVCLFALLSYQFFKHAVLPLSEMTFFGLAMVCVLAAARGEGGTCRSRLALGGLALILAAAAMQVRTAGVALVPVALWALVGGRAGVARGWALVAGHRLLRVAAAVLLALCLATGYVVVSRAVYFREMLEQYAAPGTLKAAASLLRYRLTEWGQIALNLPFTYAPPWFAPLVPLIGLAALPVVGVGLWTRRGKIGAADLYVVLHAAIVFVWPYWDPRFWLPVLPLLIALAWCGLRRVIRARVIRWGLAAYLVVFGLAGIGGLGYVTRQSLHRSDFPRFYRYPLLEDAYRAAWGQKSVRPLDGTNQSALQVLERYEPLVRKRRR